MTPLDPLHSGNIRMPSGLPQSQQQGQGVQRGGEGRLPNIPNGTLVNGLVLSSEGDGSYMVRVLGHRLRAIANLPLTVGQRFQALWDASGGMPTLRLREADLSLLRSIPLREQPLAMALLSRGLPISEEVLAALRQAWLRQGGGEQLPGALAELWSRGLPLSSDNVQLLLWYLNLQEEQVAKFWDKLRKKFRSLAEKGTFSAKALEEAGDEDPELRKFLKAHGLLSAPAREGVDPALLTPALWPLGAGGGNLARVVLKKEERRESVLWHFSFEMEGNALGSLKGHLASDGRSLGVALGAEQKRSVAILRKNQKKLTEELRTSPLALASLSIFLAEEEAEYLYRSIDMEA